MSIDVTQATLGAIEKSLSAAAADLEGTATGAPAGVDAGVMSPLVNRMLGKLTDNAAVVSEALMTASAGVADSAADYWTTEESVRQRFPDPRAR